MNQILTNNYNKKIFLLRNKIILIFLILIHQSLIIFVYNSLFPIHFTPKNIFFLELIGGRLEIIYVALFVIDVGNLILLWLISKLILRNNFSIIPPFIYAIIPWSSYLVIAESFYIYILFIMLINVYGFFLTRSNNKMGIFLLLGGIIGGVYSSVFLFILLPVILCLLIVFKLISLKHLMLSFVILFLSFIPLLFSVYTNQTEFKNILSNEIKAFSDPGLINTVNSYQGTAREVGFGNLAKISENRYIFTTEYIILKYTKSLNPTAYFTSSEKLLGFSFSPPIYIGFLIPFLFGLYHVIKFSTLKKTFLISTLLVIPSILSKPMVDLNRMIIFAPAVIFIITFGIISLYEQKNKKLTTFFLLLTLFLVIFQLLVTLSDIRTREKERYTRYYKQGYELGKQ